METSEMKPVKVSRRNFLKGILSLAALELLGSPGTPQYSPEDLKRAEWKKFKDQPDIHKKIEIINAAKAFVRELGLQIPDNNFFNTDIPPAAEKLSQANNYVGVCAAYPFDVQTPDEPSEQDVGCFAVPADQVGEYKEEYFLPKGLTTYTYSTSATPEGEMSYQLYKEASPAHFLLAVIHESVHRHLEKARTSSLSLAIEEPAAEAFALNTARIFAKTHPDLIDENALEVQVTTRENLMLLTKQTAQAIEDAREDKQKVASALNNYENSIQIIAEKAQPIDPMLAKLVAGTDSQINTARLQRHIPYAWHFNIWMQVYSNYESPQEFIKILESLPEDYFSAAKRIGDLAKRID